MLLYLYTVLGTYQTFSFSYRYLYVQSKRRAIAVAGTFDMKQEERDCASSNIIHLFSHKYTLSSFIYAFSPLCSRTRARLRHSLHYD